jgi:hypothetical protein
MWISFVVVHRLVIACYESHFCTVHLSLFSAYVICSELVFGFMEDLITMSICPD